MAVQFVILFSFHTIKFTITRRFFFLWRPSYLLHRSYFCWNIDGVLSNVMLCHLRFNLGNTFTNTSLPLYLSLKKSCWHFLWPKMMFYAAVNCVHYLVWYSDNMPCQKNDKMCMALCMRLLLPFTAAQGLLRLVSSGAFTARIHCSAVYGILITRQGYC